MIKKYYDSDCNLGMLDGKTVAIIGYGSQGHAHAQNLKESGVQVVVGLRKSSASWAKAQEAGLNVMEVEDAAKAADIVMMLVPDEVSADIYNKQVAPYMEEGNVLCYAHGFNIHFGLVKPAANIDVIMIAPKGPGHTVRSQYVAGKGVPCLVAVEQNASGTLRWLISPEDCELFSVQELTVDGVWELDNPDSFAIGVVAEGSLRFDGTAVAAGGNFFLPFAVKHLRIEGRGRLMLVRPPRC